MRAQTAAKKLGIYLPAAPDEFQNSAISHEELRELQHNPPEWLQTLRREGPVSYTHLTLPTICSV